MLVRVISDTDHASRYTNLGGGDATPYNVGAIQMGVVHEAEKVESSRIAAIGYEATTRTLEIAFTNGHVYQYFGVPTSVHQALMLSESKGKFFNDNIRDAYEFKRVR